MKKKIIIPVIILIILAAFGATFLLYTANIRKALNSSGRRGEIAYSDLLEVDGGNSPEGGQAAYSKGKTREDTQKAETVIHSPANEPLSDTVDAVSEMEIPEAVVIEEGEKTAFYGSDEYKEVIPVDALSFYAEEIPAKYDSREADGNNYITEVEDQGYSYLCWSYAVLGAVEADILRHDQTVLRRELDLSEKHLAYYNLHRTEGSKSALIDDDYREMVNGNNDENAWIFDYDTNYIAVGGVTDFAISTLTAWKGPVAEENDDSFNKIYGMEYLFKENNNPPSAGYNCAYHVQDVNEICASFDNRDMVKQMIMEHGAVTVGIYADDKYWKNHCSALYAHFDNGNVPTPNHEVLLIGWDDEYEGGNFSYNPPGKGAWLCKNSWGKNSGDKGFFYLSYYDEASCNSNVAAYSVASPQMEDWYDNNYQLAGFFTKVVSCLEDDKNTVTAYTASANPYGVMYTSEKNEALKAVGFMSLDTYQQYEIFIFVNPEVEDGNIVGLDYEKASLQQKISSISGGYHTYPLEKEVELSKGDDFFILIKPKTKGKLVYEKEMDEISDPNYDEWNNLTGNVHNHYTASGRSFYVSDDAKAMVVQEDKDFFVKAYTNNIEN